MKTDQDITMAMRSGGDQNQHWGPRSMPQATDEDLDFEDPPPYVKDDMQRVFWCLSSKVRRVLQTHQHKPLVFCFHGGFCTFFMGDLAAVSSEKCLCHIGIMLQLSIKFLQKPLILIQQLLRGSRLT